jgi:hypothetical protein
MDGGCSSRLVRKTAGKEYATYLVVRDFDEFVVVGRLKFVGIFSEGKQS